MSELSNRANDLVRLGRGVMDRPSAGDRERVAAALRERLGMGVLSDGSELALKAASRSWLKIPLAGVGLSVAGGALYLALHGAPGAAAQRASLPAPLLTPAAAPSAVVRESAPVEPVAAPSSAPEPSSAAVRRAPDRLTQEVALLTRATNELHAGRAADALKSLDEHQRKFPAGMLAEERRAAKAQALCALGRGLEARAELARLAPGSPQAARASQFCGISAARSR